MNPRKNHRYLLGLEVCVEAILLSRCAGLVCGASNVSEFARFYNRDRYEFIYRIHNGKNSDRVIPAMVLFDLKKLLPFAFGGLQNTLEIIERGESRFEKCLPASLTIAASE
jgi:hypothetical protein